MILIVDDDRTLLESIADLLLLSDFRVITAGNGMEALQAIERQQPDCIVSDIMMPEMDGFALLEAVRAHETWSNIPIILMTAFDRPLASRRTKDFIPNAVLIKPFNVDDLVETIHRHLH